MVEFSELVREGFDGDYEAAFRYLGSDDCGKVEFIAYYASITPEEMKAYSEYIDKNREGEKLTAKFDSAVYVMRGLKKLGMKAEDVEKADGNPFLKKTACAAGVIIAVFAAAWIASLILKGAHPKAAEIVSLTGGLAVLVPAVPFFASLTKFVRFAKVKSQLNA